MTMDENVKSMSMATTMNLKTSPVNNSEPFPVTFCFWDQSVIKDNEIENFTR